MFKTKLPKYKDIPYEMCIEECNAMYTRSDKWSSCEWYTETYQVKRFMINVTLVQKVIIIHVESTKIVSLKYFQN